MNQLAAFVAVAEAGTISGAAERLHVSPSALSAAVTELERALQTQLLHRRKAKGVSLSPAGEVVLPRARHLLYQASELEADARGDERGVTGVVRLGCYPRWRRRCCRCCSASSPGHTPRRGWRWPRTPRTS